MKEITATSIESSDLSSFCENYAAEIDAAIEQTIEYETAIISWLSPTFLLTIAYGIITFLMYQALGQYFSILLPVILIGYSITLIRSYTRSQERAKKLQQNIKTVAKSQKMASMIDACKRLQREYDGGQMTYPLFYLYSYIRILNDK